MTRWLSVVGIGDDGLAGLSEEACALVDGAELLVGGKRHLAGLPDDPRPRLTWPSPLAALRPVLEEHRGRAVCVLASGDPMEFGVGVTLARWFGHDQTRVIPAPSSVALACARLGWSRAEIDVVTLHGRPLAMLHRHLAPGARIVILSEDGETPTAVARALDARGYGDSRLTVLEHMGGPNEAMHDGTAGDWGDRRCADLNVIAVQCVAGPDAVIHAAVPGLDDDAFRHDGQITKREVRAATLSALRPVPGAHLWDIGAGCGSIAIEWLRADRRCRATAIERDAARVAMITENAEALGVPTLTTVTGAAPAALEGLDPPDAVFIGGGLSEAILSRAWSALPAGGRLVANTVTTGGEALLLAWHGDNGGALTRLAVSRAEPLGGALAWRALRPVTQLAAIKR